jgi:hypothetical protein
VRLCEHPDFDQAIQRAVVHFEARGLRPAILEKDCYVTEALREIAAAAGDHVPFKGAPACRRAGGCKLAPFRL